MPIKNDSHIQQHSACISRRVQACLYRGVCIFKPIPLSEHILRYGQAHTLRLHRFNSIYCRVQACLYRGVCIFKPIPLSEHILRYGRAHTLRLHRFNSIYCRVQACLYRGVCILKTIYKTYKHNSQHKPGCPGLLND